MEKIILRSVLSLTVSSIFFLQCLSSAVAGEQHDFDRRLSQKKFGSMREKLTHFRVYFHDQVSGQNPTAVTIVRAPNSTSPNGVGFGAITMIDNALTRGPELNSTLLGRAQGLYSIASQTDVSLLTVMNFVFTTGKYNGSTISLLGRNAVMDQMREMPIIGGSGLFRFARGYVQARTHLFNINNGDASVEYNVYVLHH